MPIARVVNTPQVDEALLWLLTFYDYAGGVELRAANNLEDVTSNGLVYTAFPFEIILPPDDGQKVMSFSITFPNVGRELMELVRQYEPSKRPRVRIDLILSDDPDTIEKTIDFMEVDSSTYNDLDVTFERTSSSIFARKTCSATYNQEEFPGLFWGLQ